MVGARVAFFTSTTFTSVAGESFDVRLARVGWENEGEREGETGNPPDETGNPPPDETGNPPGDGPIGELAPGSEIIDDGGAPM